MEKRACTVCAREFARANLHRVGLRAMCRECFQRLWVEPCTDEPTDDSLAHHEVHSLEYLNVVLLVVTAAAKTAFFAGLFWWAHVSEIGQAALDAMVATEVITWVGFTFLDRGFRGAQIRWGFAFEVALVALYMGRTHFITVHESPGAFGMTFMFGILFLTVKTSIWYAETVMEMTGVSEG